ncbi:MAG: squalene/phytoene synthase family protein [Candidatus Anstonellaceae archaeon]
MRHLQLCWEILPSVSRSFALCIKILPKPLNQQMMVSYLFYRILDTIEDSHADLRIKEELFSKVLALFAAQEAKAEDISRCRNDLLSKLDYTYEKVLLENLESVVRVFYSHPKEIRNAILARGKTMAAGMLKFQRKKIETFADQNRYSYYVAGVIGHLFNDLLFLNGIISLHLKKRLRFYARQFGLALQKINILRDIAHDISQNRYFWPESIMKKYGLSYATLCDADKRQAALKVLRIQIYNAITYLYSAMKYILLLPKRAVRVRMFCLIPLFMAIESYAKCIDNHEIFDPSKKIKISRSQVYDIVAKSRLWGSSNERLVNWFLAKMSQAGHDFVREEYIRSLSHA